jgi:two-component system nitrogen regulation sensor histidine kinase GlnL
MQNAGQAVLREPTVHPKVILRTRIARNCLVNQVTYPMMLEISVIDNGPGVPDEIYDTLFLPMVTQREGGTGLGLSVAMQIAQQHGGTIEVHSRAGRTQMRVLLPIVPNT